MIREVYTVCDTKVGTYLAPFYVMNEPHALRCLANSLLDEDSELCRYSVDFDLFYLGTYDDQKAKFELISAPRHITKLSDLKRHIQETHSAHLSVQIPENAEVPEL